MIDDEDIKSLLTNVRRGSRKNIICDCPFCGKEGHLYVKMKTIETDKHGVNKSYNFDCKKCGEHGRVFKLLAQLGATHLIEGVLVDINKDLEIILTDIISQETGEEVNLDVKSISYPIGFERQYNNSYLESRGFTELEFGKYIVGQTEIMSKYENYIIIGIERDGEPKSFLARSILGKKEINKINLQYKKQGIKKEYLRYRNAKSEFSRLLGGYDEINFLTDTVVLVEGFFDKVSVDQKLGLDFQHEMKCCFTFGKKVTLEQIVLLLRKGVKNVILIYDPDAINDMKNIGFVLKKHFGSVLVGDPGDTDLGDASEEQFIKTFNNLKTPWDFSLNKVQIIQL